MRKTAAQKYKDLEAEVSRLTAALESLRDALVQAFYDPDPADPDPQLDYARVDWLGVVQDARGQIDKLKVEVAGLEKSLIQYRNLRDQLNRILASVRSGGLYGVAFPEGETDRVVTYGTHGQDCPMIGDDPQAGCSCGLSSLIERIPIIDRL